MPRHPPQPDPYPDPPKGSLIKKLEARDLSSLGKGTGGYIGISDVEFVASYNWMDTDGPQIMMPGE